MPGGRLHLALLLALCAAFFLTGTGRYTHFLRAESNFALGARDMIEKGEYLLPHAAHEAPLNKPPVQYWLIGIAYAVFGYSHGASRVPAALCALAVVALVYLLGCRMRDRLTGLTAGGVLATSYIFWSFARLAMNDMLFTLCLTAVLACWMPVLTGQARRPAMLAHAGTAAMALAFLTKGPLAVALCALPVLVAAAAARDARMVWRLRPVTGTLVFLGVAAPYFLLVWARHGIEPLRNWFVNENLQRFTGASYETTQLPVLFEIGALLGDFAPWSLLLVATACAWRRLLAVASPAQRHGLTLLLGWVAAPIVFFSASSFKLDYYFMTSLPATALLVALTPLDVRTGRAWTDRVATLALWTLLLLPPAVMAATVPVVTANVPVSATRWLPHVVALATFVPAPVLMWRGARARVPLALCLHFWAAAMASYLVHLPAYTRLLPADVIARQVPPGSRVYASRAADTWALDLSLYLPTTEPVGILYDDADNSRLAGILRSDRRAVALVYEQDRRQLDALVPLRELARAEANVRPQLTPGSLWRPSVDTLSLVTAMPPP